jgi:DNA polymerase-3 subunit gamma/tau
MRDAYTLFDQVFSFSEAKITLSGIRDKMGLVGLESTTELLDAASAGNRKRALEILDEILSSGTAVEQVLVELADFLRNLTLLAYGIEKESLLGLSPERFPEGPRAAWDTGRLESAAEDAFSLYRDIRYSLNPRYELELFVGRLCSLTDKLGPEDVLERVLSLRRELINGTWSETDRGPAGEDLKKKTPENRAEPGNLNEQEAERFFSSFKKTGKPAEPDLDSAVQESDVPGSNSPESNVPETGNLPGNNPDSGIPEPAVPAAVFSEPGIPGTADTGEPACAVPVDIGVSIPDTVLTPDERKSGLIGEVKRVNLALGAALEKARRWEWTENNLLLIFDSSYEAAVVKNETETLRQAGKAAGLPPIAVDTRTEAPREEIDAAVETPRVELVRQVFRGQIVKG